MNNSDMEKWDDAALIDAVRQGIDDLRTSDAGAAAAAQTERVDAAADAEAAADADEEDGGGGSESDGDMAAADARFASLLRVGGGEAAPRSAIAPVRDPSVGEYGDWHPVAAPAAPAAPALPPLPPLAPPAGADAGLGDVLASWYYAGFYLGRYHGAQEALREDAARAAVTDA